MKKTNRRTGIIKGWHGALARAGFYTPQVQRVVKKWRRVPSQAQLIEEYFLPIGEAALWRTSELRMRVLVRTHWPLVWELARAVELVRRMPKNHPTHWLMRVNIHIQSNRKNEAGTRADSWGEISMKIKAAGGPLFSETTLRQQARRLRLV